ncbi:flagellar assembly protein FliW [Verrucomicrobia bacterium]|nr:flagellar assembly protein FliW [Verrucomicrobiota bacterium]
MNAVHSEIETETKGLTKIDFRFPHGLLGFEDVKQFCLLHKDNDSPFVWLQMMEGPELSFLLVPSIPCFPDYAPDLSRDDLDLLKIQNPESLVMYNIVTIRDGGTATANLKGPVLCNKDAGIGAQFVAKNASEFAVDQPLPL